MSEHRKTPRTSVTYRAIIKTGLAVLAFLAVLAVSGCGQNPAAPPDPSSNIGGNDPAALDPPPAEEKPAPYRAPLTGLGSEREIKERPVMIMVENSPAARPQSGLDQADIVFEILAEGDITRFVAVYQSGSPQIVGPVRSIRPYFVEIGDGLDALIVHAGWSPAAMDLIIKRKLAHFDQVYGDHAYYWRDSSRKAPHNLYTSIEKIRQGAEKKRFRTEWNGPVLTFVPKEQAEQGTEAGKVTIHYINGYYVSYEYDASASAYKRFMDGKPHEDKETGKQLSAANILICEAKHRIVDNAGRRAVDVTGPGPGYLVQLGRIQPVVWENKDGIIKAYADGKEVGLIPGQTWIQVVPEGAKVQYEPLSGM